MEKVVAECTLMKSETPYVLIPCTAKPGILGKFKIKVQLIKTIEDTEENGNNVPQSPKSNATAGSRTSLSLSISARSKRRTKRAKKVIQLIPCRKKHRKLAHSGFFKAGFNAGSGLASSGPVAPSSLPPSGSEFLNNPQFSLYLSGSSKVCFLLTQNYPGDHKIGFYLFKIQASAPGSDELYHKERRMVSAVPESEFTLLHRSSFGGEPSIEAFYECELSRGYYFLLPCSFQPSLSFQFQFSVFIENHQLEIDFIPIGPDTSFVKSKQPKLMVPLSFPFPSPFSPSSFSPLLPFSFSFFSPFSLFSSFPSSLFLSPPLFLSFSKFSVLFLNNILSSSLFSSPP